MAYSLIKGYWVLWDLQPRDPKTYSNHYIPGIQHQTQSEAQVPSVSDSKRDKVGRISGISLRVYRAPEEVCLEFNWGDILVILAIKYLLTY